MHPCIDELLSLRDGQPVAAATRLHAQSCASCGAAIRQLRQRQQSLRELPGVDVPAIDYAAIQARALQSTPEAAANGTGMRSWRLPIAATVTVCFLVAGIVVLDRGRQTAAPVLSMPGRVDAVLPSATAAHGPIGQRAGEPVARLVEQSRELDELLHSLPQPPSVQRIALAATVDRIEQRVQWLDVQLSMAPDVGRNEAFVHRLWSERVDLMDSLVKVRYAEALPMAF